uniref:Xylanase inhibitor C-terminal domain-containing protein n=1 Tax=Kalanchoe fedtschenkoi TaxID=63787 RepID=A0A7N0VKR1_KALFE
MSSPPGSLTSGPSLPAAIALFLTLKPTTAAFKSASFPALIYLLQCPTKSSLGMKPRHHFCSLSKLDNIFASAELTLYDVKASLTGHLVPCNTNFRSEDIVQYDRASGDLITTAAIGSLIFGFGARQSGDLTSSDEALDGFGNSNSSAISKLDASGVVKNMFAHCFDGVNGGEIFAIGHVLLPQVNTTSIIPNQKHHSVYMKSVEVGNKTINISTDLLGMGKNKQGAIIDSGTTLAYLPCEIFELLLIEIFLQHPDMKIYTIEDQYTCFRYSDSVDDAFPNVTFHFSNSLDLNVQPTSICSQWTACGALDGKVVGTNPVIGRT